MALEDPKPAPPPEPVVRQASMRLGDRDLAYTSTAGTLSLKPDEEKEKARVFFVAYTQDGVDVATRPLTFVFNGGPGSSSVWLHLGAFGPVRVPMPDDATAPSLPCALQPNPWSFLDLTDLVFFDPVTTGYSRAVAGESDDQFHGLDADVR
ncbi:MAG: peptidase S10, partial [Planctomycetes bacterium]|nr:peptidase S10 [Planctomycetota bacterium]